MISARSVEIQLGNRLVVEDVSLSLQRGEFIGLAGPNGAGKSTLLRGLAGLLPVAAGSIRIDGRDISLMKPGERAGQIAWLGQLRPVAWNLVVQDIAALGRHKSLAVPYARLASPHKTAIDRALEKAGASHLRDRHFDDLSGGEQARVHVARLLASPAQFLLLDEPCAALDISHQLSLMDTLRQEASNGRGVIIVLHDLMLITRSCPRAILLDHGRLVADGSSEAVFDEHRLASIFGVRRASDGHLQPV